MFKRVDSNQSQIVQWFREFGFSVAHTHTIGKGFPDLVVAKYGITFLVEVKDGAKPPSAQKLTADEERFHKEWKGVIKIIRNLEDVIALNKHIQCLS